MMLITAAGVSPANESEKLVVDFFAGMGPTLADFKRNYRERLAPDAVWESVGFPTHVGIDACLSYLDELFEKTGMEYCNVNILNLATAGKVVLTERIDGMYRADGSLIMDFRLMGAIEVHTGRITRYTDYLDSLKVSTAWNAASD